ncbi:MULTISPECIES: antibiotic biosynthesis monooxygenase family protein [unclassified Nocardiopsis]|uniref:antibiotic biosynthesis monooxygenase family protein n=1 Tax=Nocardiopsis TaxID=2013 RepID=UPI00387B6C1C
MFTFINTFTVSGDSDEFLETLGSMTDYMIKQPGFLSTRLYRSLWKEKTFVEVAVWDSADSHREAAGSQAFQEFIPRLMKLTTADPGGYELLKSHDANSGG